MNAKWSSFIFVFLFSLFMVIVTYGPVFNIFMWGLYLASKGINQNDEIDKFYQAIIVVLIVINIVLIFCFIGFWV